MNKTVCRITHQDIESFFSICTKKWKKPFQKKIFHNYQIMDVRKVWESVVKRSLAIHSFPHNIKEKTLWVQTDHSIFAQSVKMLEKNILERLKKESGISLKHINTTVNPTARNLAQSYLSTNINKEIKKTDITLMSTKMASQKTTFDKFIDKISYLSKNYEH